MKPPQIKRRNQKVKYQTREQLIRLVIDQQLTIKEAGSKLGFKPSTAKMIIKKFRLCGKITRFQAQGNDSENQVGKELILNQKNFQEIRHLQNSQMAEIQIFQQSFPFQIMSPESNCYNSMIQQITYQQMCFLMAQNFGMLFL